MANNPPYAGNNSFGRNPSAPYPSQPPQSTGWPAPADPRQLPYPGTGQPPAPAYTVQGPYGQPPVPQGQQQQPGYPPQFPQGAPYHPPQAPQAYSQFGQQYHYQGQQQPAVYPPTPGMPPPYAQPGGSMPPGQQQQWGPAMATQPQQYGAHSAGQHGYAAQMNPSAPPGNPMAPHDPRMQPSPYGNANMQPQQPQYGYQGHPAGYAPPPRPPPPTHIDVQRWKEEARRAFERSDIDRSHSLDPREFMEVLQSLGYGINYPEALRLFGLVDSNNDGKIRIDEFVQLYVSLKTNRT